jgi:predicted nucleic acid-binding protein
MATFPAVIDARVLFPALLRDILLRAAEADLYHVHWSQEILDEVTRNLVRQSKMSQSQAQHLSSEMNKAFPEAIVEVPSSLVSAMDNDLKDRHVLAAAVVAKAQVIITANLKHFPEEALRAWEIEAQHPDTFLVNLFDLAPKKMIKVVQLSAQDRRNPVSERDLLTRLTKTVPNFAQAVSTVIQASDVELS